MMVAERTLADELIDLAAELRAAADRLLASAEKIDHAEEAHHDDRDPDPGT